MTPVNVGVIGCGAISNQYLGNASKFPAIRIIALADLDSDRARAQAAEHGIGKAYSVEDLLADPDIEMTLNLTVPGAHVPIALRSLKAGKHTFSEKPLGIDRAEGQALLDAARQTGLRVGCAPDTFLGAGVQTARKLIDDGAIGRPIAFTAFMMGRGHEHWHPSPEFYYLPGGGPMFDMGPYYLTALMQMLGPIRRVTGFASVSAPERTILSKPKFGTKMPVETPDHVAGTIEFVNGCVGTIVTSFATRSAAYDSERPIQIFGDRGALKVPDPNGFDGTVMHCAFGEKDDYVEVPPATPVGYGRAVGLADMASALRHHRPHRCSIEQAFGVLDAMQGFLDSSASGTAIAMRSGYERTRAMDATLGFGLLD